MEARQRAQLTGTNRSFDLIALVAKARETRKQNRKDQFKAVGNRQSAVGVLPYCPLPKPYCLLPSFAGLVALARRSDPIPSRTRPSNALAPMVLCLKTWESRSSPGQQRTEITLQTASSSRSRTAIGEIAKGRPDPAPQPGGRGSAPFPPRRSLIAKPLPRGGAAR